MKPPNDIKIKEYLQNCADGKYPSSNYHKNKCRKILDEQGTFLYNSEMKTDSGVLYHDILISMVENNK